MVEHGVKYLHDGYTGSNPVLTTKIKTMNLVTLKVTTYKGYEC